MNRLKMDRTQFAILIISIITIISICIIDIAVFGKHRDIIANDNQHDQIIVIDCNKSPDVIYNDQSINQRDLDLLASVIYYEAGSADCTDRHQQLVAQVVLNRVASDEFPDTIYGVITQTDPIQYESYEDIVRDAGNDDIIPRRCYNNALIVLSGIVECPQDVVWQANFEQGEIYEICETSYSTTYFCHR